MKINYLDKSVWILFVLCLLTLNVTKVVQFTETIKFNMALSDVFVPFLILYLIYFWKTSSFNKTFKYFTVWISLLLWIVLVGFFAIKSDIIIDSGWIGLIEEIFKTGLCLVYFYVGYHTLNVVTLRTFKIGWSLSTLLFVFGGFAIYILASNGLYFWSDDPKYLRMFMGTDTDPNHAATYLTLSFFAMGIFVQLSNKLNVKAYFYFLLFISTVGMIFTGSRGGLIGFTIGVSCLLCFYAFKKWRTALALSLILVIMIMAFLTIDQVLLDRTFTQRLLYKIVDIESGFDERTNLSRVAWMMGTDHLLFGVGRGNYILNSDQYFKQLGADNIDNIPHNTYFGLFAETGIIGLILFFMPVFFVIDTMMKRYKGNLFMMKEDLSVLIWIGAAGVSLSVQAFVLNVENRRFLWYLAGLLIYLFENKTKFELNTMNQLSKKHMQIGLSLLLIVTLLFTIFTISLINIPYKVDTVTQNYTYELPFSGYKVGENYTIGVKLNFDVNEDRTDRMQLKVIEIGKDGSKVILDKFEYIGANGVVVRSFTPTSADSKIVLKAHKLDQSLEKFTILPLYVTVEEVVYDLTRWYFMQSDLLLTKTIEANKLEYDDWVQKTDLSLGLEATFNSTLMVKSVEVKQEDNLNTLVSVNVTVLKDMTVKLLSTLKGYPNNLHIMNENRFAIGLENYFLAEPMDTLIWKVGEMHKLVFTIPRQNGIYNLKLGFYNIVEENAVYLSVDHETNVEMNLLDLGWLNLDSFTEGIIYE